MAAMTDPVSQTFAATTRRKGALPNCEAPLLFAVLEYGEFPELLRVADVLHSRLGCEILFMFVKGGYRRLSEDSRAVIERGYSWIDAEGHLHRSAAVSEVVPVAVVAEPPAMGDPFPPVIEPRRNLWRTLTAIACLPIFYASYFAQNLTDMVRSSARDLANLLRDLKRLRRRYSDMERLLMLYRPSLLVIGQEPPATELPMLLIAAGRLKIPRLITPFAMFSLRETAEFCWAKADFQVGSSAINALVAWAFPHWVLEWKGRRFLRLQGYRALALELSGLVHGMPWSPLTEPAEVLTAESEVAAKALAAIGVQLKRVAIVGSPVHDRLKLHLSQRSGVRERVCVEYGLDSTRPLIVCGWPANIFPWLAGRAVEYPDYGSLAQAWASVLAEARDRHGVNVIVSIHPKTLPDEYRAAIEYGLPCRIGGTDELIAICDLFTTLNGSSITAWAIACGLPVLLYDCFETNYTDFDDAPGCVQVLTRADFAERLYALCASADERSKLAVAQQRIAADWGRLDGNAGRRLGDVVSTLLGSAS
jgi:hypothetical protein